MQYWRDTHIVILRDLPHFSISNIEKLNGEDVVYGISFGITLNSVYSNTPIVYKTIHKIGSYKILCTFNCDKYYI